MEMSFHIITMRINDLWSIDYGQTQSQFPMHIAKLFGYGEAHSYQVNVRCFSEIAVPKSLNIINPNLHSCIC